MVIFVGTLATWSRLWRDESRREFYGEFLQEPAQGRQRKETRILVGILESELEDVSKGFYVHGSEFCGLAASESGCSFGYELGTVNAIHSLQSGLESVNLQLQSRCRIA